MDFYVKSIENWPRMVAGQHIRIKPIEGSKKKVPDNWRKLSAVIALVTLWMGIFGGGWQKVLFSVSGPRNRLGGVYRAYRGPIDPPGGGF